VIDIAPTTPAPSEERIRLLVCNRCQTIEELPMHDRDDPDNDVLLLGLLERHNHQTMTLGGEHPDARLLDVETKHWHNEGHRREIIERIRKEEGHTGLDDKFYATRNTFREEASRCFEKHNRPTAEDGCIDFRDKSKRVTNSLQQQDEISELTRAQQESMKSLRRNTRMYICYYCPYFTNLLSKKRST